MQDVSASPEQGGEPCEGEVMGTWYVLLRCCSDFLRRAAIVCKERNEKSLVKSFPLDGGQVFAARGNDAPVCSQSSHPLLLGFGRGTELSCCGESFSPLSFK